MLIHAMPTGFSFKTVVGRCMCQSWPYLTADNPFLSSYDKP